MRWYRGVSSLPELLFDSFKYLDVIFKLLGFALCPCACESIDIVTDRYILARVGAKAVPGEVKTTLVRCGEH